MRVERLSDNDWSFSVLGVIYFINHRLFFYFILQFTGNTYLITVDRNKMKCGCIDFRTKQKTCKHLYFIAS